MYPKGRGQGLGDNLSSIALEVSLSGSAHLKHIEGKARENLPANFGFSCRKFQPGSVGISAQTNAHIHSKGICPQTKPDQEVKDDWALC